MQLNLAHLDAPFEAVTTAEYEAAKVRVIEIAQKLFAKDVGCLGDVFTEDVMAFYGNQPPIHGLKAHKKLTEWQFSALAEFENSIEFMVVLKDRVIVQNQLTYTFHNGMSKTVKAVTVYAKDTRGGDKSCSFQLYGDFTEAYQNFVAVAGPPPAA